MAMVEGLNEVAKSGNVNTLYALIQENPFVLECIDGFPFVNTPLHIAASEGCIDFVMEVMNLKPSFARKLNPDGLSPMHLALQNGQTLVVRELLKVDKDLVRVKGKGGLTALHFAIGLKVEKLEDHIVEFLEVCPECITDVTVKSQTALHIAATSKNFKALQLLICWLQKTTNKEVDIWEKQILNKKDRAGNTILHIVTSNNHFQMVKLLVTNKKIKNEINLDGRTALEMLEGINVDSRQTASALRRAGHLEAKYNLPRQSLAESLKSESSWLEKMQRYLTRQNNKITSDMRNAMLVAASLFLTASYAASLTPPGGLWEGDGKPHKYPFVGTSTLENFYFDFFCAINTATFLTSSGIVFFLLPDQTIALLTLPVISFLLCYVFSNVAAHPTKSMGLSSFILCSAGSFFFVSWPKLLGLYYRSRYHSLTPKILLVIFIFSIVAFTLKICHSYWA